MATKKPKSKIPVLTIVSIIIGISAVAASIMVWKWPHQPENFAVSVIPMLGTIQQGAVTQTTINVKGEGGYKYPVSLSASGQPEDVVVDFSPPFGPASPAYTSIMTINVGSKVEPGDFTITIMGTGADGKEHTCKYNLTIAEKTVTSTKTDETTTTIEVKEIKMPTVDFTSPKNDEEVEILTTVDGTISGQIPKGLYMWIVVNPNPSPGQWWPQGGRIDPWNGHWNALVHLGREVEDKGEYFDIAAILINEVDDQKYQLYFKKGEETGDYPGIPLPNSKTILKRIRVKRK